MGPLAGVIVSDYYLIKKKKLNVHELYKDHGIYWYDNGWNWRAYAALIIGVGPLIPGFAKSIAPTLDVGGAWKVPRLWLFPLFCCLHIRLPHVLGRLLRDLHLHLTDLFRPGRGGGVPTSCRR